MLTLLSRESVFLEEVGGGYCPAGGFAVDAGVFGLQYFGVGERFVHAEGIGGGNLEVLDQGNAEAEVPAIKVKYREIILTETNFANILLVFEL